MIEYQRPEEPEGFAVATRAAREAVEASIAAGESPTFIDKWSAYKKLFARAQFGKCGYCERYASTDDPHIDHFAPKAEVWERSNDPADRARELNEYLPNVRGPRNYADEHERRGYWWLAYDWNNYLLVCGSCNSKWKKCFFPVDPRPRLLPPRRGVNERPLLLNPFDDEAPWRHFYFTEVGLIRGSSHRGRETWLTCGLDRPTLTQSRKDLARQAHGLAREFVRTRRRSHLADLCAMGDKKRPHAGMVRRIAEQITGLPWDALLRWGAACSTLVE